jgi:transposase
LLQPLVRRTWAPRGQTPTLQAWDRHDRLSAIAALSVSPLRRRIGFSFFIHDHNVRAPDVVVFLRELHGQLGRPITLVCDRYGVHRKAIRLFQESGARWLHVEWLPAYAPELNPVEAVWNHTKYSDLANFVPDHIDHLFDEVADSLDDLTFNTNLKRSFFRWAQLPLGP